MQTPHKILYVEYEPLLRRLIFDNRQKYFEFWDSYYKEILNHCWKTDDELKSGGDSFYKINPREYYKYETHNLNKDGSISKKHDGKHLLTPEAKAKQKINFAKYQEKQKLVSKERAYKRKLYELNSKIKYWTNQREEFIKSHEQNQHQEEINVR